MSKSVCKRIAMLLTVTMVIGSFTAFAAADDEQAGETEAAVTENITEETDKTGEEPAEELAAPAAPVEEAADEEAPEVTEEETDAVTDETSPDAEAAADAKEEEKTADVTAPDTSKVKEKDNSDDDEVATATATVKKHNDVQTSKPIFYMDYNPYADPIAFQADTSQGVEFTGIPAKVKAYRVYTNSTYNTTVAIPLTTDMLNKYVFMPTLNNSGSDYIIFWMPFDRAFELNGTARDYDLGLQTLTGMKSWEYNEAREELVEGGTLPASQYYCYKIPVNGGALNQYSCEFAYPMIPDYEFDFTDSEQTVVKDADLPDPTVVKIEYQETPNSSSKVYTTTKPKLTDAGTYTYKYIYIPEDSSLNVYFNVLSEELGGSYNKFTVTINPAKIKVFAEDASKYEGETDPTFEYNCSGLPSGCRAVEGQLAREAGEKPGKYDITQGTIKIDDDNYTLDFTGATFEIKEVKYTFVEGDGDTWTKDSGEDLVFKVKCNYKDDETIDRFLGVEVDGEELDDDQYTAEAGSVVLTLDSDYLDELDTGKHTIVLKFENNKTAKGKFTVDPAPESSPQTGDGSSMLILAVAGVMIAAGAAFVYKAKKA